MIFNLMSLYKKLETLLNKYPSKIRVYLSSIFLLIMMVQLQDVLTEDMTMMFGLFVIAPIVIYYFTVLIFKKENNQND